MVDTTAPNDRQNVAVGPEPVQDMPHTKSEVRQADKAQTPLRVLIISTTIGAVALGGMALAFIWFANNGVQ